MKARYRYRFYPTTRQQRRLSHLFGCCRVAWNDALAYSKNNNYPGFNKLCKMLTQSKKTDERVWLNNVSAISLQQSLRDLDKAYQNFFSSVKGVRKGQRFNSPNFKKKSNSQSATFVGKGFKIKTDNKVYLAKIGEVSAIWSRSLPSKASSVTVIKDAANRYFLSFVVEIKPEETLAQNKSVGIDLGVKTFAVMSNGEKAYSPNYSKLDKKIRNLQKKQSRQENGSKRREKTRLRIAKLHNKIKDKRSDFLHKLSSKIVRENQTIVLEDLNVSGMVKNRKLARAISQQGWGEFKQLCQSKSNKFSRNFQLINRFEPTSQICSECGYKWGKLDLSIRSVLCLNCGIEHDRDENAAKNIERTGTGHCSVDRTLREYKSTSVAKL